MPLKIVLLAVWVLIVLEQVVRHHGSGVPHDVDEPHSVPQQRLQVLQVPDPPQLHSRVTLVLTQVLLVLGLRGAIRHTYHGILVAEDELVKIGFSLASGVFHRGVVHGEPAVRDAVVQVLQLAAQRGLGQLQEVGPQLQSVSAQQHEGLVDVPDMLQKTEGCRENGCGYGLLSIDNDLHPVF